MSETSPDLLAQQPWIRHYDVGVSATFATSARTLPLLLRDTALAFLDYMALRFFGARMRYRALDRFVAGLAARGITPRGRVALVLALPNCPQFLIEFREELPKSLVGKPLRRVLVAEELRKLEVRRS